MEIASPYLPSSSINSIQRDSPIGISFRRGCDGIGALFYRTFMIYFQRPTLFCFSPNHENKNRIKLKTFDI
ncbi:hypothetical protein DA2_3457 [Desulfovibrio sp. A2]|nr:hypothetical protein DA2_3457 [Desulfovibrio sp. A2]